MGRPATVTRLNQVEDPQLEQIRTRMSAAVAEFNAAAVDFLVYTAGKASETKADTSVWLSAEDVAERMSISRPQVYRMIRSGALPAQKIGGLLRVHRSALEQLGA